MLNTIQNEFQFKSVAILSNEPRFNEEYFNPDFLNISLLSLMGRNNNVAKNIVVRAVCVDFVGCVDDDCLAEMIHV